MLRYRCCPPVTDHPPIHMCAPMPQPIPIMPIALPMPMPLPISSRALLPGRPRCRVRFDLIFDLFGFLWFLTLLFESFFPFETFFETLFTLLWLLCVVLLQMFKSLLRLLHTSTDDVCKTCPSVSLTYICLYIWNLICISLYLLFLKKM